MIVHTGLTERRLNEGERNLSPDDDERRLLEESKVAVTNNQKNDYSYSYQYIQGGGKKRRDLE